jgi:hypothetical protein
MCLRCSKQTHEMILNFCEKMLDVRCAKCSRLSKSCDSINFHLCDVVFTAHSRQISLVMYDLLNTLLLQRRTIFATVTTIDVASINAQLVSLQMSTQFWTKIVKTHIRKTRKMRFHHQSIESEFEMRQVQIIQANTMTIY